MDSAVEVSKVTTAAVEHARLMRLALVEAVVMMPEHIAAMFTYADSDKPHTSEARDLSEGDAKVVPELAHFQPGYGKDHRPDLPTIRTWSATGGIGDIGGIGGAKIHVMRGGSDSNGDGDSFSPPKSPAQRADAEARLAAWLNTIYEHAVTQFGALEQEQILDVVDEAEIAAAERGKEWLSDLPGTDSPDGLTSLCNPLEGCFLDGNHVPLGHQSYVANDSNGARGWGLGWNDLMLHLDKRGFTLFTDPLEYLPLLQHAVKEYPPS